MSCEPPWEVPELRAVVANAYAYAQRGAGEKSPEAYFGGVEIVQPQRAPEPEIDTEDGWASMEDCERSDPKPYVIKGLLREENVACIFGEPGTGKSVIACEMAHAVAQGRRFAGMRVRQGQVLYIAAEDPTDIETRMRALAKRHGRTPNLSVGNKYCQLTDPEHLKRVVARVDKYRPKLIVIDLLAAAFPGIDENNSNDTDGMGYVVKVARLLTRTGAAIIVVHHCAKGGTTPRGSGVLHGRLPDGYAAGTRWQGADCHGPDQEPQRQLRPALGLPHRPGRPWHG